MKSIRYLYHSLGGMLLYTLAGVGSCLPRLPAAWPQMRLLGMKAFGRDPDVLVTRSRDQIRLVISQQNHVVFNQTRPAGTAFTVQW